MARGNGDRLGAAAARGVFLRVVRELEVGALALPGTSESENEYTARAVRPRIDELVGESGVDGLQVGGHHTGINRPVHLVGMDFHPDLSVLYRGHRIVAIEVKYLAAADRSGAFTKALGQCTLYRLQHRAAVALVLDKTRRLGAAELTNARQLSQDETTLAVVVRCSAAAEMASGVAIYF